MSRAFSLYTPSSLNPLSAALIVFIRPCGNVIFENCLGESVGLRASR
jgi:hypothetical protein